MAAKFDIIIKSYTIIIRGYSKRKELYRKSGKIF